MRRVAAIAVLGFAVVGVLLWASQSYVAAWEPLLRTRLEQKLGEAVGGRAHIDAIAPSWFRPINLQNVEVWDNRSLPPSLLARARQVSVGISLVDLPRALLHQSAFDAIGQITVEEPWVVLPPGFLRSLSTRARQRSRPLLFALAWDHGTFQWKDPAAPHGAWTLYQSQGRIHLRGPSLQVYARGSLEQARAVEFRFWNLARSWRASAIVSEGDVPGTLALIGRFTARPVLPARWSASGRYNLEIHSAGPWPLRSSPAIQQAVLNVPDLSVSVSPQTPPLRVSGSVTLQGTELSFQRLLLTAQESVFKVSGRAWPFAKTPLVDLEAASHNADLSLLAAYFKPSMASLSSLSGRGNLAIHVKGPVWHPEMALTGKIPQGEFWKWPFRQAEFHIHHAQDRWEVDSSTAKIAQGTVSFQGGLSLSSQTASGRLTLAQFNLHPLGERLSLPQPLEGIANGTFAVAGTLEALRFTGHLEGTSLAYGALDKNPFKLASCVMDLSLEPDPKEPQATRLSIARAVAKTQEEEIRLNPGSYVDFAGSGPARLQISSEIRNLHLGVFTLFGGLDVDGSWQIKPEGIALAGNVDTRSLYINDYQLEQGRLDASYYNGVVSFTPPRDQAPLVTGTLDFHTMPQLRFTNFFITGKERRGLRLNGDLGPSRWDFTLEGQGLDLGTLGGLAGFPYPLGGTASARIRGEGDLAHPQVQGTLDVQEGQVAGLDFQKGSAAFLWQGDRMTFTRLQLSDPGRYTLAGAGVFPLSTRAHPARRARAIDFSVRLVDSNLGLLESWSREVKQARGPVQALLQIKGTAEAPVLFGSIRVNHGDIAGAHYFRHLKDFRLAADFDGNNLSISQFHGQSGEGVFDGGGHIRFANLEPTFYNLHLKVTSRKGVDVQVPELAIPESPLAKKLRFLTTASRADVTGHASFHGPAEAPVFAGEATLTNGQFTFPPPVKNPPPPGFLERVRRINWDATLHFGEGAWFENELVEASLAGSLRLAGPSDRLKVDGGMDINEGKISYLSMNFNIQQARFDVRSQETDSGVVNTPSIRGTAGSHVQVLDPATGQNIDDTITLTIDYAAVDQIKPRLVSLNDPALSADKVLARATGLETQSLTPQERTTLYQQQMVRLIDTSLATPLARNILKRTGLIDELRVSRLVNNAGLTPAGLSPTEATAVAAATQQQSAANLLAGTKYTLEKNLSSRLALGYGVRFEQITYADLTNKLDLQSDVEVAYRLMSNVYLRGSFDLPNTTPGAYPENRVTIEPRWRFSWWGNTNPPKPPRSGEPTPRGGAAGRPTSGGPKRQPAASSTTAPSR